SIRSAHVRSCIEYGGHIASPPSPGNPSDDRRRPGMAGPAATYPWRVLRRDSRGRPPRNRLFHALQRLPQATDAQIVAAGLLDYRAHTGAPRLVGQWTVRVPGHHDGGQRPSLRLEPVQQLHPVHARHVQVQDETAGPAARRLVQELARRGIAARLPAAGLHEHADGETHRLVIVDDGDPGYRP